MIAFCLHYFVTFTFSFLTSLKEKSRTWVMPIVFLILFLFAGSRGLHVDRDYTTYITYFDGLLGNDINYFTLENIAFCEPAFYFIPYFCKLLIGQNYYYLTFSIFAFLGVYCKLRSFYLSNSWFLSSIIYLSSFFLLHEMTQVRVGVSTGILLLSIRSIVDRNFPKFIGFILLGCLFHYSSLLFIVAYFIGEKSVNRWLYGGLLTVSILLGLMHKDLLGVIDISFVSDKVAIYLEHNKSGTFKINVWNYGFIINMLFALVFLLKLEHFTAKNRYFPILYKLHVISIFTFVSLSSVPVFAFRISEVFGVVQFCLFPCIIFLFDKRFVGYLFIILLSLVNFYNSIFNEKLFSDYYTWW